jgi:hypothetical protein
MGVSIVKRNGELIAVFGYMMAHEVRTVLLNEKCRLSNNTANQTFFWRSTNNKDEAAVVGQIKSLNHRDNYYEAGLSVSQHLGYHAMCEYEYVYPVSGEIVGTGSDGEPVLANAIALDKPRRKPLKKWLDKAAPSLCPDWLTHEFVSTVPVKYSPVLDTDEVLIGELM